MEDMKKRWPFTFNFVLFAGIASVSPFIVLYYQELGFTGTQIGLLTGITPLVTFFSAPLWAGFADTTKRHRIIMSIALLGGAAVLFVFPLLNIFMPILLIAILLNIFLAPISPLADSATMFMLGDKKEMYSRIRLGGTIGYGIAAPIAGVLVQSYGLGYAFWGCAILFLFCIIISQKLTYDQSTTDTTAMGNVRSLLLTPHWLLFLILVFAAGSSMAAFNNYLYPYMKELGAAESTMGFALLVGMASEIPILFFCNRLIKRFKSYGLLMLTMVFIGLRMILFAAADTPILVLAIQLLNGLTIPAMWVAGVSYADEKAPAGMRTTAQGLFNAVFFGIGMAVGGFVGGPLLESIGGRGLYFVFGAVELTIVAIVALVHRSLIAERKIAPVP
jgi:PPP family 3-phenylpropionic acid transporter